MKLNNFWIRGPKFSFVLGNANYGGSPAKEERTVNDIAHGDVVNGQERDDVRGYSENLKDTTVINYRKLYTDIYNIYKLKKYIYICVS